MAHPWGAHRVRNRWGEGDRLRTEIIASAGRLLSELGVEEALTIRGVARAAGIAPASIYQHFADRTALVAGLVDDDYVRMLDALRAAGEGAAGDDVIEQVRAPLRAYCRFAIDNPGHYRLMTRHRLGTGGTPSRFTTIVTVFAEAFQRCEQAGLSLRVPADRAAAMVFVTAHGRVALYHADNLSGGSDMIEALLDDLIDLMFA